MPRHVRKGDLVQVISGDDRGRQGTIIRVIPNQNKVIVQGINVRRKHMKPTRANQQGGVVEREMAIHMSNVQPVVDGKPTRVRFESREDGSKVRLAASNGETIGPPLKKGNAKKKDKKDKKAK